MEKIHAFLINEYGDNEFEMERGLSYLEDPYNFICRYNDGRLSQQRVQLLRVVHMLENYCLYQVLTRRYYASKNLLTLDERFEPLFSEYAVLGDLSGLSASTVKHYKKIGCIYGLSFPVLSSVGQITMDRTVSLLQTSS